MKTVTHAANVKALKTWTKRIQTLNLSIANRRAQYTELIPKLRAMNETDKGYEELRQRVCILLVEGIDLLPIPCLSDLKASARLSPESL